MSKDLKDKAINIKGKAYVLVSDRVNYFNEEYPMGSITTELVSEPSAPHIVVKATVRPDETDRAFTGYSQAVIGEGMVNTTAALENAETSAVGRALGFMGIGVIDSIASSDELVKAGATSEPVETKNYPATAKTKIFMKGLFEQKYPDGDLKQHILDEYSLVPENLTQEQASAIIDDLKAS